MNTAIATVSLPTLPQLARATAIAVAASAAILVGAVLPAEYGIDPTGVGQALGLTAMNGGAQAQAEAVPAPAAATDAGPLAKTDAPYRSDQLSVTLKPGEGAEIKAQMRKGERFVYSWTSEGGAVKSDMHGEPFNAKPNEFTTY